MPLRLIPHTGLRRPCARAMARVAGQFNASSYPLSFPSAKDAAAPSEGPETARHEGSTHPADYNRVGRVRCYNCGQMGHVSYECSLPQVRKACYTCGNSGHMARECPSRTTAQMCFFCKQVGHTTRTCTAYAAHRAAGGAAADAVDAPFESPAADPSDNSAFAKLRVSDPSNDRPGMPDGVLDRARRIKDE